MASSSYIKQLVNLKFDNLALKLLPVDKSMQPGSRRVAEACFSLVKPTPVENPRLVAMSSSAMKLLDIDEANIKEEELVEHFSGNKILPGSETAAHCYCGHQFGAFSGQLGDGAAIYLGEVTNHLNEKWEIQIKGAGPTPYSRFGSFEIFKPEDPMTGRSGPSVGNKDILKKMLDYSISTFTPHIRQHPPPNDEDLYLKFYREVCVRTAHVVALWQCFGFCHGVLNTDNMSILGLTIDYGPFGFLDRYDPDFICNSSDETGRYSYRKQPEICHWNLKKFAEALKMCLPLQKSLPLLNEVYYQQFNAFYLGKMRKKLGLILKEFPDDEKLVQDFLHTMEDTCSDYTNTLRCLNLLSLPELPEYSGSYDKLLESLLENCAKLDVVKSMAKPSFAVDQLRALQAMARDNPQFLNLIGGEDGPLKRELEKADKLQTLENLTEESLQSSNKDKWTTWLGKYKQRLLKECDGCDDVIALDVRRKKTMNSHNPKFVLRNFIAQNAIEEAEKGNFLEVRNVLRRLEDPYALEEAETSLPQFGFNNLLYDSLPPIGALGLRVS